MPAVRPIDFSKKLVYVFPKQTLIWEELNMKSGVRESASKIIEDER